MQQFCRFSLFLLSYDFRWKELCYQNEEFDEHWLEPDDTFHSYTINQEFPIDSVLVMNNGRTLVSGSRDRSICIKDIQHIENYVGNISNLPHSFIHEHQVSNYRCIHHIK